MWGVSARERQPCPKRRLANKLRYEDSQGGLTHSSTRRSSRTPNCIGASSARLVVLSRIVGSRRGADTFRELLEQLGFNGAALGIATRTPTHCHVLGRGASTRRPAITRRCNTSMSWLTIRDSHQTTPEAPRRHPEAQARREALRRQRLEEPGGTSTRRHPVPPQPPRTGRPAPLSGPFPGVRGVEGTSGF